MKKILVIDGQGGKMGREIVSRILSAHPGTDLTAVGTNSLATDAMLRGGASKAATGENAVIVNAAKADIIIGPIGILCADALLGEITASMAAAVGRSEARKILVPVNNCNIRIASAADISFGALLDRVMALLEEELAQ